MKHGSLFSGIGGFDLAASWMGWENIFQCEKYSFCRKILQYYWPQSKLYEDICKFSAVNYRGLIDIISGGFPCQPFSTAGKRKGTGDDRYLWPEMLRVIGEVQPRWVVGENVLGLLNWKRGLVFEQVQADLEAQGYEVWPYLLPAAGIGAPHRRDRVWFVAHSSRNGRIQYPNAAQGDGGRIQKRLETMYDADTPDGHGYAADPNGLYGSEGRVHEEGYGKTGRLFSPYDPLPGREPWKNFPSQSPVCGGDDGIPRDLDGIAFSKWRQESLKGFGNAIVPQVAWAIFRVIEEIEKRA